MATGATGLHDPPVNRSGAATSIECIPQAESQGPMLLARAVDPWGTLVLLHEGFGLNGFLQRELLRYSRSGLTCVSPALFWRAGVTSVDYADAPLAASLSRLTRPDDLLHDILRARAFASSLAPASTGPVMLAGWCFGAAAVCLAVLASDAFDAAVAWYPVRLEEARRSASTLGAVEGATCPTLVFMGERDRFLSDVDRAALADWSAGDDALQVRFLADADHGFANPDRPDLHHPASARIAGEEAMEFMRRQAGDGRRAGCG